MCKGSLISAYRVGAPNLVDLVKVYDSSLCALNVVVALLQQLVEHRLDILADVPGLGKHRAVSHGEGHV